MTPTSPPTSGPTKGPWRIGRQNGTDTAIFDSDDRALAYTTWHDTGGVDEARANARLIASAPDLAAEVERLRIRLAMHHFGDHSDECDDCGVEGPSEDSIAVLQPLGIVSESGSTMHGGKARRALAGSEGRR